MNKYILTFVGLLTISYSTTFCMDKPQLVQRMKKNPEIQRTQIEPGTEGREAACCFGFWAMFEDCTSGDVTWNRIKKNDYTSKELPNKHVTS